MNRHDRRLPGDWHDGIVPENVCIEEGATVETSYSFHLFRSTKADAVRIGRGASVYSGSMLDLGADAQVTIGEFAMLNSPRIICDQAIDIGAYALISWNAVLMDSYRVPLNPDLRRRFCFARSDGSSTGSDPAPKPIRIGRNVWIGFEAIVLPGVMIGEGSIVGARSVVVCDIPAYSVAAGNPARIIRTIANPQQTTVARS